MGVQTFGWRSWKTLSAGSLDIRLTYCAFNGNGLDSHGFFFLAQRSQRLTWWVSSIARLRRRLPSLSSIVVHIFEQKYLQDQILSVASLGSGKGCITFWGRSDQNCGYHGNRKLPLTYNGINSVSTFSQSPLIRSLSNLQVMRTGLTSWMSLKLDWKIWAFCQQFISKTIWARGLKLGQLIWDDE